MSRWMHLGRMVAVALLVGLLALACTGEEEDPADPADDTAGTATTAAGTATTEATSEPSEATEVTLMLNWTPNNHHAGIYVALAQGWYDEAGIDLKVVEPATAGVDQVVAAGQADFGISVAESIIPARAAEAPIVSIATILPHNDSSLMLLGDSGVTEPSDLEGLTYGGFGGPLERELINTLIECDGGDPSTVEFVDVGNVDYIAGMDAGRYDFVWVFEGWDVLRARESLGRDVTSIKFIDHLECIPDWYTPVFIANEQTLEERPDVVRAFLEATARGYEFAAEEPDEAATMLLEAVPELDEALVRASAEYHAPLYVDDGLEWGVQSEEVWRRFEQFLRESGLTEAEVDVTEAFTNDFLPE